MADVSRRVAARIAAIAPSATLAVDAKAKALRAACRNPASYRYTPAAGLPELREAIAVKTKRDSGVTVAASQVLVTNGGKHAVYAAFQTLLDPGDEVICPAPYWTTYPETITLPGGVPVVIETDAASGFRVTVDQLEAARTERTKALLFVSPDNPSGAVYPPAEVEAIGRWALSHGIWVVTDEIYEHLTYGDHRFTSMPALVPELADTCIIVNGVAKTYAMTGWRVGWMIGPKDIIDAATNLQSHSTSNVSNVAQWAALEAVSGDLSAVHEMRAVFERRGRRMYEMLNAIPGVTCLEPQGAFYCFPSFEGVLGRTIGGVTVNNTLELAAVILDQAKVAVVPGEAFGAPGYMRLAFALGDKDLEEGINRIAALLA
jgi:aspartate aminotransferase